jgi:peptide/nickel transport system permease protein
MTRYIIRRLLQAIPLLLIISLLVFVLMMNAGDPIAAMGGRRVTRAEDRKRLTRQLGLDRPIYVQYFFWLVGDDWDKKDLDGNGIYGEDLDGDGKIDEIGTRRGVLRGDFGNSLTEKRPVLEIIGERLPNTLLLMGAYEVVVIVGALLVGIYSALHQYSAIDHVITAVTFVGFSMPIFFVALLSMYLFAVNFRQWGLPYLPTVGMFDPQVGATPAQLAWHMVLPVASLALISLCGYSRYIRSTMLEVLSQDYVRTARSKGLPRRMVIYVHALKNASLSLVTIIGLDLPSLLAGAVVTERIFAWAGMGRLFLDSVENADVPVVMGCLMLVATAVVLFQILADITYAWLDPRIRYQ